MSLGGGLLDLLASQLSSPTACVGASWTRRSADRGHRDRLIVDTEIGFVDGDITVVDTEIGFVDTEIAIVDSEIGFVDTTIG